MKHILSIFAMTLMTSSVFAAGKANSKKIWIDPSESIVHGDQQVKVCVSGFSANGHVRVANAFKENGVYSSSGFTTNILLALDSSGSACDYIYSSSGLNLEIGEARLLTITQDKGRSYKYGPSIDIKVIP